jgi:thiol:disulfide interchange protein DsbD
MKKKKTTNYLLSLLTIIFLAYHSISAQQKSLAEAKLVVDSFSPQKDSIISIGVLINLKDDWHIYWENPGDSGLPTEIDFTVPIYFKISEIQFPVPEIFYSEEIVNYGYDKQVLFISELSIPKSYNQKEFLISAKLRSLICKDLCKAFDTTLTLKIGLSETYYAKKSISDLFDKTKDLLPVKYHSLKISATKISDSVSLKLLKNISDKVKAQKFEFYPYQPGIFKNKVKQANNDSKNYLELVLEPDPFRVESPTEVKGIIILNGNRTKGFEINIPITN